MPRLAEPGTALDPPAMDSSVSGPTTPVRSRLFHALRQVTAIAIALGCVGSFVALGRATSWKLPKASALRGEPTAEADDWCKEHGVPDSECVECRSDHFLSDSTDSFSFGKNREWCKEHGVHRCPLCRPELAQLPTRPEVTAADRARADRALAFAPRVENDPKCQKHKRRIQLGSDDLATRLGLQFAPASLGAMSEVVHASGEVLYDPTRTARVAPRASGTVWRVERQVGDRVQRGDLLALVDSAEVGRAKAEFQQSLVQLDLRRETLAKLRPMAGSTIPERSVQEAEAAVEEADIRLLLAEQTLANLGMPLRAEAVRGLPAAELAERIQFLGIPAPCAKELVGHSGSSNFLPVTAPVSGEVITCSAVKDEAADPARPLFVIADTSSMRLTAHVRPEDVGRVKPGQPVRFHHTGHTGPTAWDSGTVVWVSPAANEKTRTVPVRVDLPTPSDRHRANTFGTAEIVLREEPAVVLVPSSAVHWEGCCHVVFVRDKDYQKPRAPKVFHVRTVRPGGRVETPIGPMTEIAAGLLPGEVVASKGSGALRSELLKNNLGEGCACCAGK